MALKAKGKQLEYFNCEQKTIYESGTINDSNLIGHFSVSPGQDSGILLRRGRVHKSSGPGFHMVDSDGAPNTSDSFRNAGFNTANISWSLFRTCVFTAVQRGTWKLEQLDKHHDVLDSIGGVVYA